MKRERRFDKRGTLAMRADLWGLLFGAEDEQAEDFELRGDAAIVSIEGPLEHHATWFWDSYEAISARVAAALESSASRVILKIDSPGGDVSGCFEAARALRAMAEKAGKPLVAFVDGMAASAGYALACAASLIVCPATSFVGSIGVISTLASFSRMNESIGIDVAVIASGAKKSIGHPAVPITDLAREETQNQIDSLAALFFGLVSDSRGISVETIAGFEAGMFHGQHAVDAGLADRVCTLDELLESSSGAATEATNATAEGVAMGWKEQMKKAAEDGDEDAKKCAESLDEGGDEKDDSKDDDEKKDAPPPPKKKDDDAAEDEEAAKESEEEEEKPAAAAHAAVATVNGRASVEERLRYLEEERERTRLLAKRPDIMRDPALRKKMATAPLAAVRWNVDNLPRISDPKPAASAPTTKPAVTSPAVHAAATTPAATRGATEGGSPNGFTRKSDRADELDATLGFRSSKPPVEHRKNETSIRVMTRAEAREHLKKIQARDAQNAGGR